MCKKTKQNIACACGYNNCRSGKSLLFKQKHRMMTLAVTQLHSGRSIQGSVSPSLCYRGYMSKLCLLVTCWKSSLSSIFLPIPKGSSASSAKSDGQAWLAMAALLHLAFPALSSSALCFSFFLSLSRSLVPSTFPTPLSVMTHCSGHCHDNRTTSSHAPRIVCSPLPLFGSMSLDFRGFIRVANSFCSHPSRRFKSLSGCTR